MTNAAKADIAIKSGGARKPTAVEKCTPVQASPQSEKPSASRYPDEIAAKSRIHTATAATKRMIAAVPRRPRSQAPASAPQTSRESQARDKRARHPSQHALAASVKSLHGRRRGGRAREHVPEQAEDDHVSWHTVLVGREPPPQHPLLGEAELPRDRQARVVRTIDPNLDPVNIAEIEGDSRQSGARLGGQPRPSWLDLIVTEAPVSSGASLVGVPRSNTNVPSNVTVRSSA